MFAKTGEVKHEHFFELQVNLVVQVVEIDITRARFTNPGQIILPVWSPFEPYGLAGDQGFRSGGRLMLLLRSGN